MQIASGLPKLLTIVSTITGIKLSIWALQLFWLSILFGNNRSQTPLTASAIACSLVGSVIVVSIWLTSVLQTRHEVTSLSKRKKKKYFAQFNLIPVLLVLLTLNCRIGWGTDNKGAYNSENLHGEPMIAVSKWTNALFHVCFYIQTLSLQKCNWRQWSPFFCMNFMIFNMDYKLCHFQISPNKRNKNPTKNVCMYVFYSFSFRIQLQMF